MKPNMVLPGLSCPKQETVDEVARGDGPKCLLRVAPAAVPGIAFLSGGQSSELPSDRLNRMNVIARSPAVRLPKRWRKPQDCRFRSNYKDCDRESSTGFPIRNMEYFADLQLVRLATDQQRHWLTCFQGRFDAPSPLGLS